MAKYDLRKIDPQSRSSNRYSTSDEFNSFSALRNAINNRQDIWFGQGFEVLDATGKVLFDKDSAQTCIMHYGKQFTLVQLVEQYGE